MRFATPFAASALLFSAVAANECSCPPASNNWSGDSSPAPSNNNNNNWAPASNNDNNNWSAPAPIKKVPKVKPTKKNLQKGAAKAIQELQNQNILPADVGTDLQQAIKDAIAKHSQPKVIAQVEASGTTSTITVTPVPTVVPSTVVTLNGTVSTVYMTQTITALPPGATILSNETLNALDSIQDAIDDAIAAVNLSKTGLDDAAQAELSKCLSAVLSNGGLPEGYSCISQSGSTSAGLQSTFNNILEQFLGILPSKLIDEIQDAVMPMLTDLLPDERTLLNNINSAIKSIVSSASGTSVTAIEMMQSCYGLAIKQNSNTSYLQCYMGAGGPFDTLQNGMNGVIEQFVGYLPGTLLDSVRNLTSSTLEAGKYGNVVGIGSNLTQQLNDALASVTSSLSGNSVTLMAELQQCANELLKNGNATAAQNCIAKDPAASARTMVNSVAEQFSGYLPSAFFSDLVSIIEKMSTTGQYSKEQLTSALDSAFNNANIGPAYVGCFHQVQTCVLEEISATGNINSKCAGPVQGCELMGSNNSTSLANTTLSAPVVAADLNNTTTIAEATNSTSSAALADASVAPTATLSSTEVVDASAAPTATESATATVTDAASSTAPSDASSSSADIGVASTEDAAALMKAPDASPSIESLVSSTPAASSSDAASSAEASSEAVPSSASVILSTSAVEVADEATPSVAAQRFAKKSKTVKRSHAKLRLMYSDNFARA